MQKPCSCDFLHGPLTTAFAIRLLRDALNGSDEKQVEVLYYKKDGRFALIYTFSRDYSSIVTSGVIILRMYHLYNVLYIYIAYPS